MNQKSNAGDDEQKQSGERINQKRKRNAEFARMNKLKKSNSDGLKTLLFNLKKNHRTHNERSQNRSRTDETRYAI